ncbi:MAG: flippase-like domain-containing protein [Deltaproteobacteria bacterium]|nr:flippase-like domain-containing protein [Deltaproteobacteria bacterium]
MAEKVAAEAPRKSNWARWVTLVSMIIALVALVWTIQSTGLDTLLTRLGHIGWWFAAVIGLEVMITSLDAAAMYAFLSPDQDKIRYSRALLAQVGGRAVNSVVPSGNVGEIVKVSVLIEGGVSNERAVSCILFYNLAGLLVEFILIGVAAPLTAILIPMGTGLRVLLFGTTIVCIGLSIGMFALVERGMLVSVSRLLGRISLGFAGALARIRILSPAGHARWQERSKARFARWREKLSGIDDKLRSTGGARRSDRRLGLVLVLASRCMSWAITAVLLHALGFPVSLGFFAGVSVGGFVIYLVSTMVPLGLGISEGGGYALYKALGADPIIGVTVAVARRSTQLFYATIGLVLVTFTETVQGARERQARRMSAAHPVVAPPADTAPDSDIAS